MSIFDWLLIGHFVGDWVLQSDWMAQGKKKAFFTWAGLIHFSVYTVAILVTFWLVDDRNRTGLVYVAAGTIVFVSHWILDATPLVEWWLGLYKQTSDFVRIIIDQTLHLLILGVLVATILNNS